MHIFTFSIFLLSLAISGFAFNNNAPNQVLVKKNQESADNRAESVNRLVTVTRRVSSSSSSSSAAHPKAYNSIEEEFPPIEPYAFGFNVKDDLGNNQYRKEEADSEGTIKGSYGYTDANGLYRVVEYIADKLGFRTKIRSNEPGLKTMNSPFINVDAQEPPEAVVAAASAPRQVSSKSAKVVAIPVVASSSSVHPKFRYVNSNTEVRSVGQASNESSERLRQ